MRIIRRSIARSMLKQRESVYNLAKRRRFSEQNPMSVGWNLKLKVSREKISLMWNLLLMLLMFREMSRRL